MPSLAFWAHVGGGPKSFRSSCEVTYLTSFINAMFYAKCGKGQVVQRLALQKSLGKPKPSLIWEFANYSSPEPTT